MPEPGSKRARRARPASTTTRTSGMVSEVSAIAVASTSLRPCGERRQRRALRGERQAAVQRLHHDVRAAAAARARAAVRAISAWPGRKTSTPPSVVGQRLEDQRRRRRLQRGSPGRRPRPIEPAGLDRKGAALGGEDRRPAHQRRDRRGVERRRHHQEPQVRAAARRATSSASARPRSACSAALVELVEDQAADARQVRARTAASGSARPRSPPRSALPGTRLAADAVADPAARRGSPRLSASRSAAARAATRRGSSIRMRPGRPVVEQVQRHPGGLAGAGRRLQHGAAGVAERRDRAPAAAARSAAAATARGQLAALESPPCRSSSAPRCARSAASPPPFGAKTSRNGNSRRSAMLCASPSIAGEGAVADQRLAVAVGLPRLQPRAARAVEDVDRRVADLVRPARRGAAGSRPRPGRACRPASAGSGASSRGGSTETLTGVPLFQSIRVCAQRPRRLRGGGVARRHHRAVAGHRARSRAVEEEVGEDADDARRSRSGWSRRSRCRTARDAMSARPTRMPAMREVEARLARRRRRAGSARRKRRAARRGGAGVEHRRRPREQRCGTGRPGYAKEAGGGQGPRRKRR